MAPNERRGGEERLKRLTRYARREAFEDENPKGVTGTKQGRNGVGRKKSVKRLRKPEDEAEPGEAILARVAVHHLMHRREEKPTGRAMSSVKDDVSDRMSNSGREANDRSGRSSAQARGQLHD